MCRWLAYSGDPVFLDELLFKPEHSSVVIDGGGLKSGILGHTSDVGLKPLC